MSEQKVYEQVVDHLLTQRRKAMGLVARKLVTTCMYRTPDGLSCAVGCLIPDRVYDPMIEGCSVYDITGMVPDSGWVVADIEGLDPERQEDLRETMQDHLGDINPQLLVDLQRVHDDRDVELWPAYLVGVAVVYGLHAPDALQNAVRLGSQWVARLGAPAPVAASVTPSHGVVYQNAAELAQALRETADAHHEYEDSSPRGDEHDWADWYANRMVARGDNLG